MTKETEKAFLCTRLKELREKNGCTMEEMANRIDILDHTTHEIPNKSAISRVEGGKTSEKTLIEMAKKYCKIFGMSEAQTAQFLRGDKIAVPDTSALLKNSQLIDELNKEYSKVIVPKIVIDELDRIKNDYEQKYAPGLRKKAWEVIRGISYGDKTISMDYSGDNFEDNDDCKIIAIAQAASEKYHCEVEIITEDTDYSAYLKGHESVSALHLREYMATRQGIINMERYRRVRDYYAESYDEAEIPSLEEVRAYDEDGNTLIISCIRKKGISLEQKKAKIRWLIQHHADVNQRDCGSKYLPAISHAIQIKSLPLVEFLLDECNADPNAGSRNPHGAGKVRQKNEGNMPLMIAAWSGQDDIVRILCDHEKISINQQDENGFTALIKASANGHQRCRKILLDHGADTRIIDIDGKDFEQHWNEFLEDGPLQYRNQRGNQNKKRKNFR